tara:strand:- start:2692 stop:3504 length:813 start_codon:yes stop_codon:yes gene_type:complete
MLSREEMAKEMVLRENIQKAVSIVKNRHIQARTTEILQEIKLRSIIQSLIVEAAADPEEDPHENTGINVLRDMLKNSNILKTLSQAFKSLTTDKNQRDSFRAHIVNAVQSTLAPIMANDEASTEPSSDLEEEIEIDIEDDKFIPTDDVEVEEEPEEDPKADFSLDGEDETGRNRAFEVYNKIEQSIIDYFSVLGNEQDKEMFYDYLITNIKLYFDKFEEELSTKIQEPTNPEYEDAKDAVSDEALADEEPPPEEPGAEEEADIDIDSLLA